MTQPVVEASFAEEDAREFGARRRSSDVPEIAEGAAA
jgi:hypothetical protein